MNSLVQFAVFTSLLFPCSLVAQDAGGLTAGFYTAATPKGGMAGVTVSIYGTSPFPKMGGGGMVFDAGVIARSPRDRAANAVFSANWQQTWNGFRGEVPQRRRYLLPFVTAGLSGFVIDGQGFNYGAGAIWRFAPVRHPNNSLRVEYREFNLPWSSGRLPSVRLSLDFDSSDTP